MNRLDPKIDGYYENIVNEPPVRPSRKFINPNFITSNSLFAKENELLEQRLETPYNKTNQEAPNRGNFPYPLWLKPQFETYLDLGRIQMQQLRYPVVAEIPSNIIKQQTMMNAPKEVTETDILSLRNILNQISTKSV
jgi:hypothetical protein